MKIPLKLKLDRVFGGDGIKRPDTKKVDVYGEKEKTEIVRVDVGTPVEETKKKKKTREEDISVNTFRRDEDDNYYLRLGGSHGKLWGALKEKAKELQRMTGNGKKSPFKSLKQIERAMNAVLVKPEWVQLKSANGQTLEEEVHKEQVFQEMGGRGHSAKPLHFDVIPEAEVEVELEVPDLFADKFTDVLEYFEGKYCLNKRRSTIEIQNKDEVMDKLKTAS